MKIITHAALEKVLLALPVRGAAHIHGRIVFRADPRCWDVEMAADLSLLAAIDALMSGRPHAPFVKGIDDAPTFSGDAPYSVVPPRLHEAKSPTYHRPKPTARSAKAARAGAGRRMAD